MPRVTQAILEAIASSSYKLFLHNVKLCRSNQPEDIRGRTRKHVVSKYHPLSQSMIVGGGGGGVMYMVP